YIFGRILRNHPRRILVALGVALNLGLLGYYKYAGFLVSNIDDLFGFGWVIGHIILPLAISFFTFEQISFIVDCYKQRDAQRDPLEYAAFVTFFPHLIAGPIIYHRELSPQFELKGFGRVGKE